MAQIHPFTNPFFKTPTFDATQGVKSHFDPYTAFFKTGAKNNPFMFGGNFSAHWMEFQQQYWHDYLAFLSWQQQTLSQNMADTTKVMMHCMQLWVNPTHYYRYVRRNWQKPYSNMGAQMLTGSKLLTKLMADSMCAWQKAMSDYKPH